MLRMLFVLLPVAISGCANDPFMNEEPQLAPYKPKEQVTVERPHDRTVCVIEAGRRTCVPVVDAEAGEQ